MNRGREEVTRKLSLWGSEAACCCFGPAVARGYRHQEGDGGGRLQGRRGVTTGMR